ncbi:MAG: phospho-N-acetylmuramoyl-pentapeptide-transferase [Anaerolineae bacterium]|nr:phospho-N-acetylmuramoyl-pentapeptide-transferase [Anaerolineae bacterium]
MFPWLGNYLRDFYGPFRLLTSYLFLAGLGTALAAGTTWIALPRLWRFLPTDHGRAHAVEGQRSQGKPVSAGVLFIPMYVLICLLILHLNWQLLGILGCVLLSMLEGFADDKRKGEGLGGWSEYQLGVADLGIAVLAALILSQLAPVEIWLPLTKIPLTLPVWLYVPLATAIIWLTINATNCTDGVDGLSGGLSALAFLYMGGILYAIVGHRDIAQYLLVPHYPDGADWGTMAFVMVGILAGYLWHNAYPSAVLMGDSGSRPMGFLLGVFVLTCGNPFLVLIVSGVVLINGATGLLKVALLRFFKIGIFKTVRYPLHDHVRHAMGWSNTQVMVRFMLLQAVITPLLLILLLKVR